MAETPEAPKAPATTPVPEWVIPNQDKFEQVIDARLAAHAENEESEKKPSRSARATPAKDADKS